MFLVCNAAAIPQIGNGTVNTTGSDTAPYFVGEVIRYQCNANYSTTEANLINECIASSMGSGAPADWSRSEGSLASVCQPCKYKILLFSVVTLITYFFVELPLCILSEFNTYFFERFFFLILPKYVFQRN